jgi:hypothetical protein
VDAKQQRGDVGGGGQEDVGYRESRVKNARGDHRDGGREGRRAAREADRREAHRDPTTQKNRRQDQRRETAVRKQQTRDDVPQPRVVIPARCAGCVRPRVIGGNAPFVPDEIAGGEMPSEVGMAQKQRRDHDVKAAGCRKDQKQGAMYGRRPRCKRNLTISEAFGCGHVFGL